MKRKSSKYFLYAVSCFLLAISLACGNSGTSSPENKSAQNINSNSAANKPASNTNDSNSGDKTSAPTDLSGEYSATGKNADGGGDYTADLLITNRDDVYQFSWDSKGVQYDGVGVQTGNNVAVSFTDGTDGKGCGVILYKINSDGSLDGKAGYWGTNEKETEKATRTGGSGFEGEYDVEGKNPNGDTYKSKLNITKLGEGYKFAWTGANSFEGFGIRQGDTASVGFGGDKCSFVAYEVKPDGTLEGKWGGQKSTSFGTETAKKK